jgi:hypothetical protein
MRLESALLQLNPNICAFVRINYIFANELSPWTNVGNSKSNMRPRSRSWQTKSEGWGITLNAIYSIHLATTFLSGNQREKTATQNVQFTGTDWRRCLYRYVCNCFSVLFHVWGSAVRVRPPDKVPWSERQIRYTGLTSGLFKKGGAAIRTFNEAVLTSSKLLIYLNLIEIFLVWNVKTCECVCVGGGQVNWSLQKQVNCCISCCHLLKIHLGK